MSKLNQIAYTAHRKAALEGEAVTQFRPQAYWTEGEAQALIDRQPDKHHYTISMEIVADVTGRRQRVLEGLSPIERLLVTAQQGVKVRTPSEALNRALGRPEGVGS